ncbi:MAG: hypothetical protein SFH39_06055, partial [Candidatus Magnetobacterium sp. LHC-1]
DWSPCRGGQGGGGAALLVGGRGRSPHSFFDEATNYFLMHPGILEIFSCEGYTIINETQEKHINRETLFEGTIVNIALSCDALYYRFSNETTSDLIF